MNNPSLILTLSVLSAFSIQPLQAYDQAAYTYSCQNYGKETVERIEKNGAVYLNGTKVTGRVNVNGSMNAKEAEMESLQVNGSADLNKSVIVKNCTVNGTLNATNTIFQAEVSVASEHVILSQCQVASLKIKKLTGFSGNQIVELRDGTKITGPINFESGNGVIWLSPTSEVNEEQVTGIKFYKLIK